MGIITFEPLIVKNKQKHRGSKMRTKHTHQMSIYEAFSKHEAVSDWLDAHLDTLDWISTDVQRAQADRLQWHEH